MEKRWYIVHAYSNFERKVADAIRERAANQGLAGLFEQVLVPMEEYVEVRRGRKVGEEIPSPDSQQRIVALIVGTSAEATSTP